jgi:hypothetical protein
LDSSETTKEAMKLLLNYTRCRAGTKALLAAGCVQGMVAILADKPATVATGLALQVKSSCIGLRVSVMGR